LNISQKKVIAKEKGSKGEADVTLKRDEKNTGLAGCRVHPKEAEKGPSRVKNEIRKIHHRSEERQNIS